jgi:thioesterase domain-containing protein
VSIFSKITEKFNRELPLATLFQASTVEAQAKLLSGEADALSWRPLVQIQAGGAKTPIFCVHALSGNVLYLRDLAVHLGSEQPFYGLQAQGLDGKQAPITVVEEMAANYVAEIRTVQPSGPYILAGHSLGGAIAFEMAQQLVAAGEKVAMLALLDSYSPELVQKGKPPVLYRLYMTGVNLWRLSDQDKLLYTQERILLVPKKIKERLHHSNGKRQESAMLTTIQLIEEANMSAVNNYTPQSYPGKITLFRSLQRWTRRYDKPDMGWGTLAAGGVEIHPSPGNHFSMILEPRVSVLASKFKQCLEQIDT